MLHRMRAVFMLLAVASGAQASENPLDLLDAMGGAMRTLNYEGTFVYRTQEGIETLQIIHSTENGQELERLITLNGTPREVIRENERVTCILPDKNSVYIDKKRKYQSVLQIPDGARGLALNYSISMGKNERIAGRKGKLIDVTPRDDYRYGYRFWLDSENYFPLRTDVMGKNGEVLEQIMFTLLSWPDSIPKDKLSSSHNLDSMNRYVGNDSTETQKESDKWVMKGEELGFRLLDAQRLRVPGNQGVTRHYIYSDGLASLSVYVDENGYPGERQGYAQIGAVNSLRFDLGKVQVTLVGEVPMHTLKTLAHSIKQRVVSND